MSFITASPGTGSAPDENSLRALQVRMLGAVEAAAPSDGPGRYLIVLNLMNRHAARRPCVLLAKCVRVRAARVSASKTCDLRPGRHLSTARYARAPRSVAEVRAVTTVEN